MPEGCPAILPFPGTTADYRKQYSTRHSLIAAPGILAPPEDHHLRRRQDYSRSSSLLEPAPPAHQRLWPDGKYRGCHQLSTDRQLPTQRYRNQHGRSGVLCHRPSPENAARRYRGRTLYRRGETDGRLSEQRSTQQECLCRQSLQIGQAVGRNPGIPTLQDGRPREKECTGTPALHRAQRLPGEGERLPHRVV